MTIDETSISNELFFLDQAIRASRDSRPRDWHFEEWLVGLRMRMQAYLLDIAVGRTRAAGR